MSQPNKSARRKQKPSAEKFTGTSNSVKAVDTKKLFLGEIVG